MDQNYDFDEGIEICIDDHIDHNIKDDFERILKRLVVGKMIKILIMIGMLKIIFSGLLIMTMMMLLIILIV